MSIHIYGAGMSGLLAAHMLRGHRPVVHELQTEMPDNHGALLRFRSDVVSREVGLPFKRVQVQKAIKTGFSVSNDVTLRDANMYSYKVSGQIINRSVLNLSPCERYVAFPDFLAELARGVDITLGDGLSRRRLIKHRDAGDDVISTIPMPVLMNLMEWSDAPNFQWRPIWSVTISVDTEFDLYQTIYYPNPNVPHYRASITGKKIILECMVEPRVNENLVSSVLDDFGIQYSEWVVGDVKRQEYGKLLPLPDEVRQRFVLQATDQWRVYSVGRFATWRQILLDDVVQDVRKVSRWIRQRNSYARRLETAP